MEYGREMLKAFRFSLISVVCFVYAAQQDVLCGETSSPEADDSPAFGSLSEEELEAAEELWASYKDLKDVHEVCATRRL